MLPELTTWNNGGGGTPSLPRVQLSAVVEAPFIYIFGGSTISAATNATIDRAHGVVKSRMCFFRTCISRSRRRTP